MSLNWVMLSDREGFVSLPNEQRLWTSSHRTSLSLQSLSKDKSHEPLSITCADGRVFLTTRRIVYLPTHPPAPAATSSSSSKTPFQSFASPITHLHDTHVTAPWFGPNEVLAVVQPVPNGGIPAHHPAVKLTLTFREGGAYDFHTKFVQVRERLAQALEARGLAGIGGDVRHGGNNAAAEAAVAEGLHLEDLPAYEEPSGGRAPPVPISSRPVVPQAPEPMAAPVPVRPARSSRPVVQEESLIDLEAPAPSSAGRNPDEPPPGYEETQRSSVAQELERRLSGSKQ